MTARECPRTLGAAIGLMIQGGRVGLSMEERIAQIVADAPPFTHEQAERLRAIFSTTKESSAPHLPNRGTYFIQAKTGGPIKIGRSDNFHERLKSLQIGSPLPLALLGVIRTEDPAVERQLHRQFAHLRMHGEWFEAATELTEYINRNCEPS